MIDLNPKYLETVQRILTEHVPECEVRAYGSRVTWTARDYSDLDLAVVGRKPFSLRRMRQLKEAFEESDLPIRVDVWDWYTISDGFKRAIAEEYEVIQDGKLDKETAEAESSCQSWNQANNGWEFVRLGNVVSINPRRALQRGKTALHVSMKDIEAFRREIASHSFKKFNGSATRFQNEDTLLARITPCLENGKTAYVNCLKADEVGHGSTEFIVLSGIEGKTDNLFIYYLARDPRFRAFAVHSMQGTTGRQRVAPDSIGLFELSLPPIEHQRRIAHILGTLDDKIELNRQMNETLEATARAIFKSWFVDFDPVRAKMEGREPVGMDAETAVLFPSAFQDSPLGAIPEGWEVGTLGEVAQNVRRNANVNQIDSDDVYVGLEHIPKQSIALSKWQSADGVGSNKSRFRKGEILFGKLRPYFHKVGVAPIDGVCSTDILVIQPTKSEWFGIVLGIVSRDEFVAYTDAHSTGTRMPRTNWRDMSRYDIALPQANLAKKYTELIQPWIERIINNIHQSHTLSQIREALLPKLLSGQIRVD